MDISTAVGLGGMILLIVAAIMTKGPIGSFWDTSSFLIVLGGTVTAVMVSYPIDKLKATITLVKKAFGEKSFNLEKTIEQLSHLSYIAKRDGLLALEKTVEDLDEEFMKKGILMVVDGMEPKSIEKILELDVENMIYRHAEGEGVLKTFGKYAPAFGMIGTLVGLILMLQDLNDVATLGPNMGVALITTFYGAFLSNGIFLPLAGKLKFKSDCETQYKIMVVEGILSVQAGETPMMIEEKLRTFLPQGQRNKNKDDANEVQEQTQ
jgi:chemotaxis protein MotA